MQPDKIRVHIPGVTLYLWFACSSSTRLPRGTQRAWLYCFPPGRWPAVWEHPAPPAPGIWCSGRSWKQLYPGYIIIFLVFVPIHTCGLTFSCLFVGVWSSHIFSLVDSLLLSVKLWLIYDHIRRKVLPRVSAFWIRYSCKWTPAPPTWLTTYCPSALLLILCTWNYLRSCMC